MGPQSSVSVDDDLKSGDTSISHRFTDDEVAARVDVVHSVVVKGFLRDISLVNFLHNLCPKVMKCHLL